MFKKELGRTGVKISEIGLGTWNYHAGPALLRQGLMAGPWFVDTAESYGTEAVVGEALKGIRGQIFLATKLSPNNFRRNDLVKAAERSLRALQTDWIDLYQLHGHNQDVPIEETFEGLERLVDAGKVRFIGVSNYTADELCRAQKILRKHPIVANQVRYNLADRTIENGLLSFCREAGISVIAYSPLANGLPSITTRDPKGVLAQVAAANGKTVAQVAINWCLRHDDVVAISKGNSASHLEGICGASGWRLSAEEVELLSKEIGKWEKTRMEKLVRGFLPEFVQEGISRVIQRLPAGIKKNIGST